MKSKLRNINVNQTDFRYLINEKYQVENNGYWLTTLRVFRKDFKKTPLEIKFKSNDGYATGNMLTSGIMINEKEFNLHKPIIVRELIEEGIAQKWNWENSKLEIPNGLKLLAEMGYNIESLKPIN